MDTLVFFTFTDITRAWRVAHNDKKSLDLENVQLLIIVLVVVFVVVVVVVTCSCCFWSLKAFSSFEQTSLVVVASFSVWISRCVYKGFTKFGACLQLLSLPGELAGLSQLNKVAKPKWQNPWSEFVGNHAMEVEVGYLDDSSAVEHFGKGPLGLRHPR